MLALCALLAVLGAASPLLLLLLLAYPSDPAGIGDSATATFAASP